MKEISQEEAIRLVADCDYYSPTDSTDMIDMLPCADSGSYIAVRGGAIIWDEATETYQLEDDECE